MKQPLRRPRHVVLDLFRDSGALLEGHFQLSSGLHSPQYMQCALLLAQPGQAERLGEALAGLLAPRPAHEAAPPRPDLVVSPALGGLIIGHEVARALGVRAYFAERESGAMTLRRGFALKPGERVAVVEDVVTTGKSTREVMDLVRAGGAEVVAGLCIVDRTGGSHDLGVPLKSLLQMKLPAFSAGECPQCRQGLSVVKPGSRPQPIPGK